MSGFIRNANGLSRLGASLVGVECADACCGEEVSGECGLCDGCPTSFVINWALCEWQIPEAIFTVETEMVLELCPEIDPDTGLPNPPCSYRPTDQTQVQTINVANGFCEDTIVINDGLAFCATLENPFQFGWLVSVSCQDHTGYQFQEVEDVLETMIPPFWILRIRAGFETGPCALQGVSYALVAVATIPPDSCLASAEFVLVPFAFSAFYDLGDPAIELQIEGLVTVT